MALPKPSSTPRPPTSSPASSPALQRPSDRLAAVAKEVDGYIDRFLNSVELCPELRDACRYALLGGGKRLRPGLVWMACEAVGAPGQVSLPAGVAVEMIHAFSLVHDDLPAMDDDDLRRGRPTLHIHAGEALAILAGDALLSMAFEVLCTPDVPLQLSAPLCRELAQGTRGMIDGQVLDTLGSSMLNSLPDAEAVEAIHQRKTGALIAASVRMGALTGLCHQGRAFDGELLEALDEYGLAIGLMFQAVDDLLDVESTAEQLGKRTGKDASAGKKTYPQAIGLEGTRKLIGELRHKALESIEDLGDRSGSLRELAIWLADREV